MIKFLLVLIIACMLGRKTTAAVCEDYYTRDNNPEADIRISVKPNPLDVLENGFPPIFF